jgi:hypothetical protein
MIRDDDALAAFVDGELAPGLAAAIEAEAARDAALAARIARHRDLRHALTATYGDALAEPPPERLLAAVRNRAGGGNNVIELGGWRRPAMRRLAGWGGMAASLILAFGAGLSLTRLAPSPAIQAGPSGGLVARGVLAEALDRQLASRQAEAAPVRIGVSFQAADGRYCRTFLLRQAKPLGGLACRDPAGWRVSMVMQAAARAPGAFRTAGEDIPAPVMDAVDASIRGRPLDAGAEARARDSGWIAKR